MNIRIPEHSVLGVYINSSICAVVQQPTIEKILTAVREELCAEDVTSIRLFPNITFEWDTKFEFEVRVDNGEDKDNQNTETVELMPIVIY